MLAAKNGAPRRFGALGGMAKSMAMPTTFMTGERSRWTDAIRWHGGEGAAAKAAFDVLDEQNQTLLLAFLAGL